MSPLEAAPGTGAVTTRIERPALVWLATFALLVEVLARGQAVLVPLALSVVIAFALNPAVKRLGRRLGRAAALAIVVFVAFGALVGFGLLLDLSAQMTKHSESMRRKVVALRDEEGAPGEAFKERRQHRTRPGARPFDGSTWSTRASAPVVPESVRAGSGGTVVPAVRVAAGDSYPPAFLQPERT